MIQIFGDSDLTSDMEKIENLVHEQAERITKGPETEEHPDMFDNELVSNRTSITSTTFSNFSPRQSLLPKARESSAVRSDRLNLLNMGLGRGRKVQLRLQQTSQIHRSTAANSKRAQNYEGGTFLTDDPMLDDMELTLFPDDSLDYKAQRGVTGVFDYKGDKAYQYEQTGLGVLRDLTSTERYVRFELPLNPVDLEGLDPIEYLVKYCRISDALDIIYSHMYTTLKSAGKDNSEGVIWSIKERLTGVWEPEQSAEFQELTELDKRGEFELHEFKPLLGLAERLYGIKNLKVVCSEIWPLLPGPLERADFYNLKEKLQHVVLHPSLRNLLIRIEQLTRLISDDLLWTNTAKSDGASAC
ncbi:hypothetical protein T265_04187 [Opisthorchis viverrini]|uniref:Uncharacterized protein n=1 Tax=Opisthorchis viverrini TaxID=6198 RepID=A0A074ZNX4_OPIVI|nr:hypothetical protein T265_04187 [Opisthorchis viverrini]KER29093.1 hypothetical protein T265_04187 [Opisthorchis viverrini]